MRKRGTKVSGGGWTESEKQSVWNKGKVVLGRDSSNWRKDECGDLIFRSYYGDTDEIYGWEIDHIVPVSKNGSDVLGNLRPLQWDNNRRKSDTYPWNCN